MEWPIYRNANGLDAVEKQEPVSYRANAKNLSQTNCLPLLATTPIKHSQYTLNTSTARPGRYLGVYGNKIVHEGWLLATNFNLHRFFTSWGAIRLFYPHNL